MSGVGNRFSGLFWVRYSSLGICILGQLSEDIVACRVFQGVFRTIDLSDDILFEVIIKS